MKNTGKILGVIALVAIIAVSVTACGGGLSGSYSLTGGGDLTYNFLGGGKVTMESGGKVLGEGTYKTSGGKLTFEFEGTTQAIDYKLEGKNLILTAEGQSITFAKK
ncbi:MAG: hypothetical protein FWC01_05895 [Treponema sp.]|nr:hypothetical protein [Treponema sp.]MCL2237522.1 hypothetical protein [Treponema sp.]